MEIKTRLVDEVLIIDIIGEVDLYNAPQIKELILGKVKENNKKILINLKDVSYIDSSGIGALIFCRSTLRQHNGALGIVNIHGSVKRVFELTKLTSIFSIFDDESVGVKTL